jgi:hypothetical protein
MRNDINFVSCVDFSGFGSKLRKKEKKLNRLKNKKVKLKRISNRGKNFKNNRKLLQIFSKKSKRQKIIRAPLT